MSPNGTLSITFLDMTDSGVYMCFARNEAGETKKATWIKVNSMFVKKLSKKEESKKNYLCVEPAECLSSAHTLTYLYLQALPQK